MHMLKIAVKVIGRFARYRIVRQTYLNDRLYNAYDGGSMFSSYNMGPFVGTGKPTYLRWRGLPNEAMVPANWAARIIWPLYKWSLGKPRPVEPAIKLELAMRDKIIAAPVPLQTPSLVFERKPLRLHYPKMQKELGKTDGDERTANL